MFTAVFSSFIISAGAAHSSFRVRERLFFTAAAAVWAESAGILP